MKENIPLHKSLKFKINALVTIVFLGIIFFMIFRLNKDRQEILRMKEDSLNQITVDTIDRRFQVSYEILETSLAQIAVNPLIIDAIEKRDSDELFNLISQPYEKLREVGVDEFHFYLSDDSSLLNVYEINKDKTVIPCDRDIVRDINSDPDHKQIKSIEECEHGLFLRYIAPIYNNDKYIGSMELGMKIEERILNIFKDVSGGEWYLYSLNEEDKSFLSSTIDEDKYPIHLDRELMSSLNNGEVVKIENSPYIIQMIPLSNYNGEYNNFLKQVFDNSELISLQNSFTRRYLTHGVLASIISALFFWIVLTYLLEPLIYLEKKVRNLESGKLWDPIQVTSNDEIGYLAKAMENMRQSLYTRENQLKEQSYTDPLTGAYNRLYFENTLDEIINKELYPVTLIMADIDELKQINDNQGHAEGDTHIIKCTEIIQSAMRDNDFIFRIGGDEFILVFPSTEKKTGEAILKRIKREFENYNNNLEKDERIISVSFGLATCQGGAECLKQTISIADKEMYKNKNHPEN